jgi:hypothetical protein
MARTADEDRHTPAQFRTQLRTLARPGIPRSPPTGTGAGRSCRPRLAANHPHLALARPHILEPPIERLALAGPAVQESPNNAVGLGRRHPGRRASGRERVSGHRASVVVEAAPADHLAGGATWESKRVVPHVGLSDPSLRIDHSVEHPREVDDKPAVDHALPGGVDRPRREAKAPSGPRSVTSRPGVHSGCGGRGYPGHSDA